MADIEITPDIVNVDITPIIVNVEIPGPSGGSVLAATLSARDEALAARDEVVDVAPQLALPRAPRVALMGPVSGADAVPAYRRPNSDDVQHTPDWTGATPLLLRDLVSYRYNPRHFGCVGDGVTDDTVNMDKALRECAARRLPLWLDQGTYIVKPTTPMWNELGGVTLQATAITIDYSNFHIIGAGGFIEMRAPPSVLPSGIKYYAMMTPEYLTPGTIKNARFEGEFFRHAPAGFDSGLPGQYVAGLCGIEGLVIRDCHLENPDYKRGHGFGLYDCRDVAIENFSLLRIQQGFNIVYGRGYRVNGFYARQFTEAMDVNQNIYGGTFTNMVFAESDVSGESQCLDLIGQDLVVSNFVASDIGGNGLAIYSKLGYASYADHRAAVIAGTVGTQPDPYVTQRVSISNVRFKNTASAPAGYPSILIMNKREAAQTYPTSIGVTLRDVVTVNSGPITFQEGLDVGAEDITMYNPIVDSRSNFAAFCATRTPNGEPGRSISRLTGSFRNISVYGSAHSGVVIDGLESGEVSGIRVHGFGLDPDPLGGTVYGVRVANLAMRDGLVIIGGIESIDTAATGDIPFELRGSAGDYVVTPGANIMDRGGYRIKGTIGTIAGGNNGWLFSMRPLIEVFAGRINVRNPSFSSSVADGFSYLEIPLWTQGEGQSRYLCSQMIFAEAPVGAGSCLFAIRKRTTAGVTTALAAHPSATNATAKGQISVPTSTLDADRPEATLLPGEQLILTVQRDSTGTAGLGVDCPDVRVLLSMLQYGVA